MSHAAFSTDVEDYFQAEALRAHCPRELWPRLEDRTVANVDRVLGILDRNGAKGTFFVLGWTAERHPGMVRRIAALGHEIASHGYAHELITRQDPSSFREDVRRARGVLQGLTGQAVLGYRAPSYTVVERTRWALPILAEEGHAYDSSIFPIRRRRYGIPGAPRWPHRLNLPGGRTLIEFPLPTVRFLGVNVPATGGAYLRLLPFGFQRWAVGGLIRRSRPLVVNVHPWELDPGQPRLPVGVRTRLTHYTNLHRAEERLVHLLSLGRFRSQGDVLQGLNLLPTSVGGSRT